MRLIRYILFFVSAYHLSLAQNNPHYFVKTWGQAAPVFDGAASLIQLPDSSYFVTASSHTPIQNTEVKHVFKLGKFGNIIAQVSDSDLATTRSIGGFLSNNQYKTRIYSGNGMQFYYSSTAGISVPYIFVFDSVGNFLSPFIIGDTSSITGGGIYSTVYSTNNELLNCGTIYAPLATSNKLFAAYWKADTLGNTLWERRDSSGTCCPNEFISIREDNAHNFVMLGHYMMPNIAASYERLWLRKINTNGSTLWDYKYQIPDLDTFDNETVALGGRSLAIANDGNYIVGADYRATFFGYNQGFASAVIKFSAADGHIIWRYDIKELDTNYTRPNYITKIISIPGEGYVLFGTAYDNQGDLAGFMLKINENGQELWRKKFGTSVGHHDSNHDDYIFDGIKTMDGGYAAVGQTASVASLVDNWFIKTNCNGDTAAPKAMVNIIVDTNTPNQMQVFNLSQYYDSCTFLFSDGTAPVTLSVYDSVQTFTHAFAPGTTVTVIAKACNQEWDTLHYTQISTANTLLQANESGLIGSVFPNPANNTASFTYFIGENHHAVVQLINATSELLQSQTISGRTGNATLNTSHLSTGVYLLKLIRDDGIACYKKLLIQH